MARNAARQEQVLSLIYQQKSTPSEGASSKDDTRSHTALHANQNSLSGSVSNGVNHLPNGGLNTGDEVSGMSVLSTCDARSTEPTRSKESLESRPCSNASDVPASVCSNEESGKSEATKESSDKKIPSDLSSGVGRREELAAVAFLVSPTAKSGSEICERQKSVVSSTKVTEIVTNTKPVTSLSATNPPVDVFTASSPCDGIINLSVPLSPSMSSTVVVSPSPSAKERVTFSKHVVEIPEGSNDCQNRPKRIPPPPPPRKMVASQGNTSGSADNSVYENVDSCKQDAADQAVASNKMARPQSVFGLFRQSETVLFMKPRPISEYVQGGFQSPPSKLSSATTSPVCFTNGNRGAIPTKEPVVLAQASAADKLCCQKDSDSDSSTSADSQTGTIKRNPHTKDETPPGDKKQQTQAGSNGNISRETSRIPPPVPLRKTSTLSSQNKTTSSPVAQHQYSNIQELRREHALLEKQQQQGGHVARKSPRTADSSLANGEIAQETKPARTNAGQNSKTERRKCEETEIY